MNRFRFWLQNFMTGRYGADQLNRFMLWVSLGLMLLQLLFGRRIRLLSYFYPLALILLILCYFRMFSRNYQKRAEENQKFLELKGKAATFLKREKEYFEQRKTHHIYKCPSCKQKIRVPKGKGKICITCPKCHTEFIKKS